MSEPIYRREIEIPHVSCDCFGRLKTSWLLALLQETAGAHCNALGVGTPELLGRPLFWAVSRHRVQISRLPGPEEPVRIETWPCPSTRVAFPRSAVAYDRQGKELFRSLSLWILMDMQSRAMVLPGKSGVELQGLLTGGELMAPGSLVPVAGDQRECRGVKFSDLDENGHMNNTRYLDWVADLLPSVYHREHPAREFVICYLNEAREGQQLELNWKQQEQALQVDARWEDPEDPARKHRIFAASIQY